MRFLKASLCAFLLLLSGFTYAIAEDGILVVQVTDTQGRPLAGVVLTVKGDGAVGPPTDNAGKTRIKLAPQTPPGRDVSLQLVRAERDLVFISPWNNRVTVPPFDSTSELVVEVVMTERGNRLLLETPEFAVAIISKVNELNAVNTSGNLIEDPRKANLESVANLYGFSSAEVERAVTALETRTGDPYQLGIVALYKSNYAEATKQLSASLRLRENEPSGSSTKVADAAFFLGHSLYKEGKYKESIAVYERALVLRPGDSNILNALGMALEDAGDYPRAEASFTQALQKDESALGKDHPDVAVLLNNLGLLYYIQGKYSQAEPLLQRSLTIRVTKLRANHPDIAQSLNNLGLLFKEQGRFVEAEAMHKKAKDIWEEAHGPGDRRVGTALINLGGLYSDQGKFAEAEQAYKRTREIWERALGVEHPDVALVLNNLGQEYNDHNRLADAEALLESALAIREKMLGQDHPDTAQTLNNLAILYQKRRRFTEAEQFYQRTITIYEAKLGPDHRRLALALSNQAVLYIVQNKSAEAEASIKRAIAIKERQLGPNHTSVAETLEIYARILSNMGRSDEAEQMLKRIKAIRNK
jgi:tetratricopeptide (TPR) repeat protein